MPQDYPVLQILPDLKVALAAHKTVILQAPPGAGKSTVLPLQILEEVWLQGKKILMLEPRRLAARSVAARMASLRGENTGDTIGFRIRFENNVSERTRIEVVTEGILTRQIQNDNTLDGIGLIIFDEFHERSLQADLALVLCLQVQQVLREDLRILIMSATLDTASLSPLLGNAPVISSDGKQYPVEVRYNNFDPDAPLHVRMTRAIRKALQESRGDILAFFPGAGEIRKTEELLLAESTPAEIHVLYGDLPIRKQQEAIQSDPSGRRKIVLSTSLAETSLTIEGISIVVDCGYSRVPRFDPRSGLSRLQTVRITKDSATQRTGRAGRLGPGICYRLWSEGTNASLVAARTPEIMDADLAPLMLEIANWGVTNIYELPWITPPPAGSVAQASSVLAHLGAMQNGKITDRGKRMLRLPTHPRIAHMLLEAGENKKLSIAVDIAALLEERDPLGKTSSVDLTLRVEALRSWRRGERVDADKNILMRLERLIEYWRKLLKLPPDNTVPEEDMVGKLITAAYPERIARQAQKGSDRYKLANGQIVRLPAYDPLTREMWLAVAHLDAGVGEGKIFLAAPVSEKDLEDLAKEEIAVRWDSERGMVTGAVEKRIGNAVLRTSMLSSIPQEKKMEVLFHAIRTEGLRLIGWSEKEITWQARVMSLRIWRPEEAWPDVTDLHLLHTLEDWLAPYIANALKRADLQRIDLGSILPGLISWELLNRFEKLAPEKIEVPSGSMIPLVYFIHGQTPIMEVRLQEVFGMVETPAINEGKIKIILHLLSPGYKPVQVTQDLKSFWLTAYHEVRQELRIRYRKHAWPEDPMTAQPVRGAIRKKHG